MLERNDAMKEQERDGGGVSESKSSEERGARGKIARSEFACTEAKPCSCSVEGSPPLNKLGYLPTTQRSSSTSTTNLVQGSIAGTAGTTAVHTEASLVW
eukprot:3817534-Rhodomonas_salina.2